MAGHGEPGRFVEEYRKKHKNRRRGLLLSWAQVKYYQVPQGMKRVAPRSVQPVSGVPARRYGVYARPIEGIWLP
jgi:hypothetical protein